MGGGCGSFTRFLHNSSLCPKVVVLVGPHIALRVILGMGRKRPCIRDKLEDKRACYSLPVGVRIHILPSLNPLLPHIHTHTHTHTHRPPSQSSASLPITSTAPQGRQPVPQDLHLCSSRAPCCSHKPGCSPVGARGGWPPPGLYHTPPWPCTGALPQPCRDPVHPPTRPGPGA